MYFSKYEFYEQFGVEYWEKKYLQESIYLMSIHDIYII